MAVLGLRGEKDGKRGQELGGPGASYDGLNNGLLGRLATRSNTIILQLLVKIAATRLTNAGSKCEKKKLKGEDK